MQQKSRTKQISKNIKKHTNQELTRVRPSNPIEALNSNPPLILKQTFVNNVRGLLSMFRNNIVRRKPIRRRFQLIPLELSEARHRIFLPIFCTTHNNNKKNQNPQNQNNQRPSLFITNPDQTIEERWA